MKKYSKGIRKKFRELANLAWQRELNRHIASLAERFDEWWKKKIYCEIPQDILQYIETEIELYSRENVGNYRVRCNIGKIGGGG